MASSPPGPSNFITTSGSANRYARPGRLHSESKEIRAGPYSGSPVPRNSLTSGPRESFTPRVQGWGDSRLRAPSILPQGTKLFHLMGSLNWASGLNPLGRLYLRPLQCHFHSLGLTNRFTPPRQSDPVVLANLLRQWLDPHFLTSGIPIRSFQVDYTIFTHASNQGWGAHMGDSKISGTWTLIDHKLHINCLELKAVTCALQHRAPLLQGHQVMVATDNLTVVSYINKQGGTRSTSLLRLTIELFLWLESQDIIVRARHIPGCLNVIADHLSRSSVPEVHLRRKVIPSARMEALMRHYKAAGFSDEVSRLAAAPRRPSTNRMYDDRWCRFTRWAAGQGVDPLDPTAAQVASLLFDTHGLSPRTIKGYRTCIGSVLNRTGRAKVVLHRTIYDMISSMELQRPRATPVLPQWDLGVC